MIRQEKPAYLLFCSCPFNALPFEAILGYVPMLAAIRALQLASLSSNSLTGSIALDTFIFSAFAFTFSTLTPGRRLRKTSS